METIYVKPNAGESSEDALKRVAKANIDKLDAVLVLVPEGATEEEAGTAGRTVRDVLGVVDVPEDEDDREEKKPAPGAVVRLATGVTEQPSEPTAPEVVDDVFEKVAPSSASPLELTGTTWQRFKRKGVVPLKVVALGTEAGMDRGYVHERDGIYAAGAIHDKVVPVATIAVRGRPFTPEIASYLNRQRYASEMTGLPVLTDGVWRLPGYDMGVEINALSSATARKAAMDVLSADDVAAWPAVNINSPTVGLPMVATQRTWDEIRHAQELLDDTYIDTNTQTAFMRQWYQVVPDFNAPRDYHDTVGGVRTAFKYRLDRMGPDQGAIPLDLYWEMDSVHKMSMGNAAVAVDQATVPPRELTTWDRSSPDFAEIIAPSASDAVEFYNTIGTFLAGGKGSAVVLDVPAANSGTGTFFHALTSALMIDWEMWDDGSKVTFAELLLSQMGATHADPKAQLDRAVAAQGRGAPPAAWLAGQPNRAEMWWVGKLLGDRARWRQLNVPSPYVRGDASVPNVANPALQAMRVVGGATADRVQAHAAAAPFIDLFSGPGSSILSLISRAGGNTDRAKRAARMRALSGYVADGFAMSLMRWVGLIGRAMQRATLPPDRARQTHPGVNVGIRAASAALRHATADGYLQGAVRRYAESIPPPTYAELVRTGGLAPYAMNVFAAAYARVMHEFPADFLADSNRIAEATKRIHAGIFDFPKKSVDELMVVIGNWVSDDARALPAGAVLTAPDVRRVAAAIQLRIPGMVDLVDDRIDRAFDPTSRYCMNRRVNFGMPVPFSRVGLLEIRAPIVPAASVATNATAAQLNEWGATDITQALMLMTNPVKYSTWGNAHLEVDVDAFVKTEVLGRDTPALVPRPLEISRARSGEWKYEPRRVTHYVSARQERYPKMVVEEALIGGRTTMAVVDQADQIESRLTVRVNDLPTIWLQTENGGGPGLNLTLQARRVGYTPVVFLSPPTYTDDGARIVEG